MDYEVIYDVLHASTRALTSRVVPAGPVEDVGVDQLLKPTEFSNFVSAKVDAAPLTMALIL